MAQILLLTPQLPYPPHQGTSLRNYHMLKALAHHNQVTLLSFAETDRSLNLDVLNSQCRVLPPIPVPIRSTQDRLRQLVATGLPDMALRLRSEEFLTTLLSALDETKYDAVQIEGIELAAYIDVIRQNSPSSRIVLDCHNAETELQRRAFSADVLQPRRWPAAFYSRLQIGRLAGFERGALSKADTIIAVSDTDQSHLNQLLGEKQKEIVVIPNTIDIAEYLWPDHDSVSTEMRHDLVFTGKMDYRPNIDGVLWFAEAIWPEIRRRRPDTTWAIVGQRPHARLDSLRAMNGITVTGHVPHIQPYLAGASLYITPLRIGSGTRLKIIEAMAAGKPVISTTMGAEGFDVEDRKNIVLVDNPAEWVDTILTLLDNPAQQAALGAAARNFAKRYDWRCILPAISAIYPD